MDQTQLRDLTRRVLTDIGLWSESAENLLMGTFAQESGCGRYIRQLRRGPALGIGQMEPVTHDDIWFNYLAHKSGRLWFEIFNAAYVVGGFPTFPDAGQLEWNLAYAICMTRIHYLRVPDPLPAADDVSGMAMYWKWHYNTRLGRGTEAAFLESWNTHLRGLV